MSYLLPRIFVISIVTLTLSGIAMAQFAPAPGNPFAAGSAPVAIASGDFNGDGLPDFAIANQSSNNVTVLLGTAGGGYTPSPGSPYRSGAAPLSLVVTDFNGDGHDDLAIANSASANVTVL